MLEILRSIWNGLFVIGLCCGPILFIAYGLPAMAYISKRRNARKQKRHNRQHTSKFPYRIVAYLLLGITLLTLLASLYLFFSADGVTIEGAAGLVSVPLLLSIAAFRAYILQNMPTAAEAVQEDQRPPVLYLRSFDQEMLKFVHLPNEEKKKYNSFLNYAADVDLPPFEQKIYKWMNDSALLTLGTSVEAEDITFEKYFRGEVTNRIGPFIALGNPIDSLPAEGAFRDYQIDEQWKDVFFKHSERCACILMQLGSSDNLQYELTAIVARNLPHKLFIITPPQADVKDRSIWVRKYILREKIASWEIFSEILKKNGYQVPGEAPGIGSVLTFEKDGTPLVIAQNAFTPQQYIEPIVERLKSLKLL